MSEPTATAELLIISPREKELGGFTVRRLLPFAQKRMVGPWIFFDHMGPAIFPAGQGVDVRPHPHINLATVTYLFNGEILHRDSLGSEQAIAPGDINLMVAGKGIVHSERERDEIRNRDHVLHGLQLWLALPEEYEEVEPAFHHYPGSDIPSVEVDNVWVRVLIGEAYEVASPVKTFAETVYAEAEIPPDKSLELPEVEECGVYVLQGQVEINGTPVGVNQMAVTTQPGSKLLATTSARVAIIGGEKLGDRHIEWNFVSSDPARIEAAKQRWQAGEFPLVPGDEEERIPYP